MKRYLTTLLVCLCTLAVQAQISKEYFFAKGTNELIDRKYSAAIESFNLLLKIDTAMYDAYFRRAVAKYNLGDAIGALADFSHAIRLNPVFTYAYFYRAIVRNSMGNHQDALKDLDEVESLRPQFSEVHYSRGVSFFYLQQFQQALANYNEYLRRNPNVSAGYLMRGACQLFLKDTAAALADYDRAISLNTFDPDGYSRRGRLYALQGKYDLAMSDFNHAIKLDTAASINYYFRALTYYNCNKIDAALADLDKVLLLDPYNALVHYNRAIMYAQIGNLDAALADYNHAAVINPSNVLIYYNRAAIYMEKGNIRNAIADYSKTIELYPDFANAYLNRSYAKRRIGDINSAKADYDAAQKMIAEHQRKMGQTQGSSDISFADTSRQYDKLVAFDADFGNKDFSENLLQYQRADITLQPLYRISVGAATTAVDKDLGKIYYNENWEHWRQQHTDLQMAISPAIPQRSIDERQSLEHRADHIIDSVAYRSGIGYFAKATLLAEQNMYNAALNFYKQASGIERENPFYLLAQSAAQSGMIDFISSVDQNHNSSIVIGESTAVTYVMPDTKAGSKKGNTLQQQVYDYSEAIAALDHAIALLPTFAYTYYNRANLKCHSNLLPEAIEDYSAAIAQYPYFADAYYNRGLIQIYLHDTNKGCLDMSKAGELGISQAYNVIKRYCK
jgi:tetratricopeptide (TPR) repeat protein